MKYFLNFIFIAFSFIFAFCKKDVECKCTLIHKQSVASSGYNETKQFQLNTKISGASKKTKCSSLDYTQSYKDSYGVDHEITYSCKE